MPQHLPAEPSKVSFATEKLDPPPPLPQPLSGKARIVLVQNQDTTGICIKCAITVKVGVDGSWRGATSGSSFLPLSIDPGQHHLCAYWQNRITGGVNRVSLSSLNAESGKTYYFVQIASSATPPEFSLTPLNEDEGRLLMASSPQVEAHVK